MTTVFSQHRNTAGSNSWRVFNSNQSLPAKWIQSPQERTKRDDDAKILDFRRLEEDIVRNVLGEDEGDTGRCDNTLISFPSFNYVPLPIPDGLIKSNPILKLRPGESASTFHQSEHARRVTPTAEHPSSTSFPFYQGGQRSCPYPQQQPSRQVVATQRRYTQIGKACNLPRIPECNVITQQLFDCDRTKLGYFGLGYQAPTFQGKHPVPQVVPQRQSDSMQLLGERQPHVTSGNDIIMALQSGDVIPVTSHAVTGSRNEHGKTFAEIVASTNPVF